MGKGGQPVSDIGVCCRQVGSLFLTLGCVADRWSACFLHWGVLQTGRQPVSDVGVCCRQVVSLFLMLGCVADHGEG